MVRKGSTELRGNREADVHCKNFREYPADQGEKRRQAASSKLSQKKISSGIDLPAQYCVKEQNGNGERRGGCNSKILSVKGLCEKEKDKYPEKEGGGGWGTTILT